MQANAKVGHTTVEKWCTCTISHTL